MNLKLHPCGVGVDSWATGNSEKTLRLLDIQFGDMLAHNSLIILADSVEAHPFIYSVLFMGAIQRSNCQPIKSTNSATRCNILSASAYSKTQAS